MKDDNLRKFLGAVHQGKYRVSRGDEVNKNRQGIFTPVLPLLI